VLSVFKHLEAILEYFGLLPMRHTLRQLCQLLRGLSLALGHTRLGVLHGSPHLLSLSANFLGDVRIPWLSSDAV